MPIRTWLLAGLVIAPAVGCASAAQAPPARHVVLVTLDGVRWQEVFTGMAESLLRATTPQGTDVRSVPAHTRFSGAGPRERRERLMPFLWGTFAVNHGFIAGDRTAGSLVSVANRHWFSYPGYSEMLTGQAHDDVIKSNDAIRNPFPTVLEFARARLRVAPAQIATFASWGVFNEIAEHAEGATLVNAGTEAYASPAPHVQALSALQHETPTKWENTRRDAYTFRFAIDHLTRAHPRALYVAFDETDEWAHDGRYDLLLETLHRMDSYLKELWETLQADPQYRGTTTVIVTTDHGRGRTAADWQKHAKDVPGSDETWIAVASPDSPRRGVWRGHPPLFQHQVAATMAAALGLDYREQNPQAGQAIAWRD